MRRATVTADLEVRVLEASVRASVAKAAAETGLAYQQAAEIARRHGYPDIARVRSSLAALRATAGQAPSAAADAMTGRTLRTVRVADLHPDPDNPRQDLGDVTELAASIRASGLLQPILVRQHGDALVVVAGHRRLAALQLLGDTVTEVVVARDMRPVDVLAAMLIENGQRRDLTPMEEARAYDRLKVAKGWSVQEISDRVGRSTAVVYERLALLSLSPEQQALVDEGAMGIGQGAQAGRARAGRVRGKHRTYLFHLGAEHPLAGRARSRCKQVHNLTGVRIVGSTACGQCWEHVIRADESRRAYELSVDAGRCRVCDHPVQLDDATAGHLEAVTG